MFNDATYLSIIQPIKSPQDDVSDLLNFGALRASDEDDNGFGRDQMMNIDYEAEEGDTVQLSSCVIMPSIWHANTAQ